MTDESMRCSGWCELLLIGYLVESELVIKSVVQGHHIYKNAWNLSIGRELLVATIKVHMQLLNCKGTLPLTMYLRRYRCLLFV